MIGGTPISQYLNLLQEEWFKMKLSIEQKIKIASLRNVIIHHRDYEIAYETIEEAYKLKAFGNIPQRFLCIGQSGTGKSTIKDEIQSSYPRTDDGEASVIPILTVDTPPQPSIKSFAEEILIQLGDPVFYRGSATRKTNRILKYFNDCKVKLVIFDELQHFVDKGKNATPSDVADWFKSLIEKSNISAVLMGLERSQEIVDANEQLSRRFSKTIDLKPFNVHEEDSRIKFQGIIRNLDEEVGLDIRLDVSNKELVKSLHFATNGIIDYMVKLFVGAHEQALIQGCNSLTKACFEKAFSEHIWSKGVGSLNPFNEQFIGDKLNKPGMPFFYSTVNAKASKRIAA